MLFKVPRFEAEESNFLHLGYGADWGPFLFLHEIVRGGYVGIELQQGRETLPDQVTAWSMTGSWMITGESYDLRPFHQGGGKDASFPRQPLWAPGGRIGPGAFELAARYSNGDIDREFFLLGFTNYTTSSQEFRTFAASLSWYPFRNVRAAFEVVRTLADQRPAAFDSHGRDTSYLFRIQYSF